MGNSGSAHQLSTTVHVSSELHSYYKQQQLRRATKQQQRQRQRQQHQHNFDGPLPWTQSLPHVLLDIAATDSSGDAAVGDLPIHFKVLPQVNEALRLRTTTNGAILHAGGTISGRRTDQPPPVLQQRARSFICDDSCSQQQPEQQQQQQSFTAVTQQPQPPPTFRRAQTLLSFSYAQATKRASSDGQNSADVYSANNIVRHTNSNSSSTRQNMNTTLAPSTSVTAGKLLNKYSKKRKAPPAPHSLHTDASAIKTTTNSNKRYNNVAVAPAIATTTTTTSLKKVETLKCSNSVANEHGDGKNIAAAKTRLFQTQRTKAILSQKQKQQKQQQQPQQCSHLLATKTNSSKTLIDDCQRQVPQHSMVLAQKMPNKKNTVNNITDNAYTTAAKVATTPPMTAALTNLRFRREKSCDAILVRPPQPQHNSVHCQLECSYSSTNSATQQMTTTTTIKQETASDRNCKQPMVAASKIPQFNRTFYFGMNVSATVVAAAAATAASEKPIVPAIPVVATAVASGFDVVSAYKLPLATDFKPIVDNGLLIQMRPTLPRRQLDTPSFSPAAAWRMLMDREQQQRKTPQNQLGGGAGLLAVHDITSDDSRQFNTATLLPYLVTGNGSEADDKVVVTSTTIIDVPNNRKRLESPIQLTRRCAETRHTITMTATPQQATWTPQQDLDDDDDDDDDGDDADNNDSNVQDANDDDDANLNNAEVENCSEAPVLTTTIAPKCKRKSQTIVTATSASVTMSPLAIKKHASRHSDSKAALHVFSLSLPRDVQRKSAMPPKATMVTSTLPKKQSRSYSTAVEINAVTAELNNQCCCCSLRASKTACPLHAVTYRNDNWVLQKMKTAISNNNKKSADNNHYNEEAASLEPISLTLLATGKHVMYLPGSSSNCYNTKHSSNENANNTTDNTATQASQPQRQQQLQKRPIQRRQRMVRHSLQDVETTSGQTHLLSCNLKESVGDASYTDVSAVVDKAERFTFQSTIRLLEKRRLAEKLARAAELREAQRKTELEAMKRVEEEFQRKRAFEKANIRHQLHLYFSDATADVDAEVNIMTDVNTKPQSLHQEEHQQLCPRFPLQQEQRQDDCNNNIACRADPDGAVSTSLPRCLDETPELHKTKLQKQHQHKLDYSILTTRHCYDSEGGEESDIDLAELANFKRSSSLLEPYLQSIYK